MALTKVLHADFGIVRGRQDTECPKCAAELHAFVRGNTGSVRLICERCLFTRPVITLMRWDGETWRPLKC